nr:hypothetical protein [Nocardia vaccinii]
MRTLPATATVRAEITVRTGPVTALPAAAVTAVRAIRGAPRLRPPSIILEGTRRSPAIIATPATIVTTRTIAVPAWSTALAVGTTCVLSTGTAAVSTRRAIPIPAIIIPVGTTRPTGFTPLPGPAEPAAITTALPIRSATEPATVTGLGLTTPEITLVAAIGATPPETPAIIGTGAAPLETATIVRSGPTAPETASVAAFPTAGTTTTGAARAIPGTTVPLVRTIRLGAAGIAAIGTGAPEAATGPPLTTVPGVLARRILPIFVTPLTTGALATAVAAERFATVVLLRHGGPFLNSARTRPQRTQ